MADVDLSFKLLSTLSKERAVYGLRNGDHERYRRHCANKIHRLRQVTNTTCGKGKTYKSPPKLDSANIKDVRHLQLLLFSAERALAHSHELKALKNKSNSSNPPQSIKKDQVSWLRRSLKLSTSLFDAVSSVASDAEDTSNAEGAKLKVDQRTLAEVTIYHLTIRSELSFERNNFIEALSDLAARRRILTILAESAKDSYDEALAHEFIDSQDPLIRYCAYKLGRAESHDIAGVMSDITEDVLIESLPIYKSLTEGLQTELGSEMEEGRKKLQDVTFAGEKVELRNAEIVKVMSKVQDALAKLESGKKGRGMRGWDRVLAVLGEAEGVARRLVDDHEASGSSTSLRSAQVSHSLSLAHGYVVYLLLSHRIRRDLQLIDVLSSTLSTSLPADINNFKIKGGKTKVEETVKSLASIIKLLDTVLQSLRGIAELSIVQEKEGVRVGVEGLEAYYHALRCTYLARLHCLHPTPSYASAISLISRATASIDQARALLVSPPVEIEEPIVSIPTSSVDSLEGDIKALEVGAKNGLFAQHIEKPVFFDMAFNYIDMPFEDLEVLGGKKEAAQSTLKTQSTSTKGQGEGGASSAAAVVSGAAEVVVGGAEKVVERVKQAGRATRETTPMPESRPQAGEGEGKDEEGKKGWLGGWFGRGK